jgi:sugar/nucleoside kinase (ribokinase family)
VKDISLLSVGAWAPFDHIFRISAYPSEGETIPLDMDLAAAGTTYFGDCSINVAYVAAVLGTDTALASIVGGDFDGSGYRAHLEKAGINLEGLTALPDQLCGHNYIFFDPQGRGFCFSHLGAAAKQSALLMPPGLPARCENIVVSERFSPYTLAALRLAKQGGARAFLNGMVDTADDLLDDFLALADVLFINESEFTRLIEKIGREDLLFGHYGLALLFITMGRRGCRVVSPAGSEVVPITRTDHRVDTTGAGDSFAAGTISAILRGYSPVIAARVGSTVSSFVIEAWGCQTRVPSWTETEQRLKENYAGGLNE